MKSHSGRRIAILAFAAACFGTESPLCASPANTTSRRSTARRILWRAGRSERPEHPDLVAEQRRHERLEVG